MNTPFRKLGGHIFEKIASLSNRAAKNNSITLPCMYFCFGGMRIIFVTKVTGVDKATTVLNDTMFLCQFVSVFRILSHSTRLKFLI